MYFTDWEYLFEDLESFGCEVFIDIQLGSQLYADTHDVMFQRSVDQLDDDGSVTARLGSSKSVCHADVGVSAVRDRPLIMMVSWRSYCSTLSMCDSRLFTWSLMSFTSLLSTWISIFLSDFFSQHLHFHPKLFSDDGFYNLDKCLEFFGEGSEQVSENSVIRLKVRVRGSCNRKGLT